MFGKVVERQEPPPIPHGNAVLEVTDLSVVGRRLTVDNVSLTVRSGEVIGLAGLDGSGQGEFIRACTGLVPPLNGSVRVAGRDMSRATYHRFVQSGVAFLPAGRLEEGLIKGMTLTEHFALTMPGKAPWVNWLRAWRSTERAHPAVQRQRAARQPDSNAIGRQPAAFRAGPAARQPQGAAAGTSHAWPGRGERQLHLGTVAAAARGGHSHRVSFLRNWTKSLRTATAYSSFSAGA